VTAVPRPRTALPRPGPRWGRYPQRPGEIGGLRPASVWPGSAPWAGCLPAAWLLRLHQGWIDDTRQHMAALQAGAQASGAGRQPLVQRASLRLRREGLTAGSLSEGLAVVGLCVAETLGRRLHDTQLLAAALLLDQRGVEMATGEGKTLAMAAAAAVAALAGVPVHVVTANDYLAERDALEQAPLWQALGLRVGHIAPGLSPAERRWAYGSDIVFSTAKELAFDHLRDCLARPGSGHEQAVMRGLCLALLDEADSILLDEAVVPLVIAVVQPEPARHQAQRRAVWWQAAQLASQLQAPLHFGHAGNGLATRLTDAGEARLAEQTRGLTGVWRREGVRRELVQLALTARHALHRDQHYLVRDRRIELLDTLTGRVAVGRVWSRGLQALIELKEGCPASPPTETLAQLSFQGFFRRYWRLGGLSGTLAEARRELASVHGLRVLSLPTRLPSRRETGPTRVFDSSEARWQALVRRATELQQAGRPVLIGTDSVADSERLSWHLSQADVAHAVLNARHDQHEASLIAQAGQAGRITVSTRMAGRGTDITPDARALAAGGLHVIHCQCNESRRMDRQLWGRSARQGQPGSTETWLLGSNSLDRERLLQPKLSAWILATFDAIECCFPLWRRGRARLAQWLTEQRQAAMRRQLMEIDRQWEQQHRLARRPGGSDA
jgi:preprotein translocase subunit SecA